MTKKTKPENLRGNLEDPLPQMVRGWAAVAGQDAPRHIRIEIGEHSFETQAAMYRPDLEKSGVNRGNHGFVLRVPVSLLNGSEYLVRLIDVETGILLGERPMRWKPLEITDSLTDLDANPIWRGMVDGFEDGQITGWALATTNPLERLQLEVLILGVPVFRTWTSSHRPSVTGTLGFPAPAGFGLKITQIPTALAGDVSERLRTMEDRVLTCGEAISVRIVKTGQALPLSTAFKQTRFPRELFMADIAATRDRTVMNDYVRLRDGILSDVVFSDGDGSDVKVLANYLTQFHPFAENNDWWGEGFTEWTNVSTAQALFEGHHQPHVPADLGYYDLRLDAVHERQIALAKQYGISGFIYYFYWFSGKTVMTMPLDRHLEKNYDLDFCLCWANENWSRRWDGSEKEVLLAQRHVLEDDVQFIHACLKYFSSERYIKIDGAPLLQVYRISLMDDPVATIQRWKEIVRAAGYPDLHVSMCETFDLEDPSRYGCDSSSQFPPHRVEARNITSQCRDLAPGYTGIVYDYADVVANEIARPAAAHVQIRAAMPAWDNTSRKGLAGNVFHGSSPELFRLWMTHLVDHARKTLPVSHRYVIVNAWNEWAEGAHLEPDRAYGHANLRAVREALQPARRVLSAVSNSLVEGDVVPNRDLKRLLEGLINSNRQMSRLLADNARMARHTPGAFIPMPPSLLNLQSVRQEQNGAILVLENFQGRPVDAPSTIALLDAANGLQAAGWLHLPGVNFRHGLPIFASLRELDGDGGEPKRYIAVILERSERPDVAESLNMKTANIWFGFRIRHTLRKVPTGRYAFEIIVADDSNARSALVIDAQIELVIA